MLCPGHRGRANLVTAMLLVGLLVRLLVNDDCGIISGVFISRRMLVLGHFILRLAKPLANHTCCLVCISPRLIVSCNGQHGSLHKAIAGSIYAHQQAFLPALS